MQQVPQVEKALRVLQQDEEKDQEETAERILGRYTVIKRPVLFEPLELLLAEKDDLIPFPALAQNGGKHQKQYVGESMFQIAPVGTAGILESGKISGKKSNVNFWFGRARHFFYTPLLRMAAGFPYSIKI